MNSNHNSPFNHSDSQTVSSTSNSSNGSPSPITSAATSETDGETLAIKRLQVGLASGMSFHQHSSRALHLLQKSINLDRQTIRDPALDDTINEEIEVGLIDGPSTQNLEGNEDSYITPIALCESDPIEFWDKSVIQDTLSSQPPPGFEEVATSFQKKQDLKKKLWLIYKKKQFTQSLVTKGNRLTESRGWVSPVHCRFAKNGRSNLNDTQNFELEH